MLTGVLLSGFFFAHKVGQILKVRSQAQDEGRTRTYQVIGQVDRQGVHRREPGAFLGHHGRERAGQGGAQVAARGAEVEVTGLNEASATLVGKFAVHDKAGADDLLLGH